MDTIDIDEYDDLMDLGGAAGTAQPRQRDALKKRDRARRWGAEAQRGQLDAEELEEIDIFSPFRGQALITGQGEMLKPGKEATVYKFAPGAASAQLGLAWVAIKVYKDIQKRSFNGVKPYLEGRLAESGMSRRNVLHTLSSAEGMQGFWVGAEYKTLSRLFDAGVPVPRPLACAENAVAMEFLGGEQACPRLSEARLPAAVAPAFRKELLDGVEKMLTLDIVHGDLSPYNVLVRDNRPVIIDFPQAIDPRFHSEAARILERDLANVLKHFEREYGIPAPEPQRYAESLLRRHNRG
jgi:RIO kinase 1